MSETVPITVPYVALPHQPAATPWPTDEWPTGQAPPAAQLDRLLDELFDDAGPLATTYAAVVIHRGRLVAERYADDAWHAETSAVLREMYASHAGAAERMAAAILEDGAG